jgi:hypothetical protein
MEGKNTNHYTNGVVICWSDAVKTLLWKRRLGRIYFAICYGPSDGSDLRLVEVRTLVVQDSDFVTLNK